ncbi:hypothetical protein OCAR_5211 [Afipia carboxidovorans OM5]|nr:hypothetical protein OCAR_5211 [Afipia carboxidovorans OM5]
MIAARFGPLIGADGSRLLCRLASVATTLAISSGFCCVVAGTVAMDYAGCSVSH